jgi:hypothetical protein
MLKPYRIGVIVLLLGTMTIAASQQPPKPKVENGQLGTNNSAAQPTPPVKFPTLQEITEAVVNGIERAENQHDENHPAPPPDNSIWWFNFLLVVFTGLLVIVGGANCFLIFWTLKATQTAADAAKKSADVAERALVDLEGPYLYPNILPNSIQDSFKAFTWYEKSPHTAQPSISFTLKNYGRTLALPQSLIATLFFGGPDDVFKEEAGWSHETLLGPGESSQPIERQMLKPIGMEEYKSIIEEKTRIFLRGSVVFYDVFGNEYMQAFCLARHPKTHRFTTWGVTRNARRRTPIPNFKGQI